MDRRTFVKGTMAAGVAAMIQGRVQGAQIHGPINIRLCFHPDDPIVAPGELLIDELRDVFGIRFFGETDLGRIVELSLPGVKAVMEDGLAPKLVGKHNGQEIRAAGTMFHPEDVGWLCIWNHNPRGFKKSWTIWLLDSDIQRVLGSGGSQKN